MTVRAERISYSGAGPQPEAATAVASAFKYRAFLSYSHRDTNWAKWLHGALEGYRVDKDLIGRETPFGLIPKTLRPIFRDRDDFSAGHSLTEQTLGALEVSQFLIVLCSPNAARSAYVNEEIRHFKSLGRTDRVIAVIVDGEPSDEQRECFPPAMRLKLGADGEPTGEREEPIAADARVQGDGKQLTLSKVIAGLLGIGLDEVVRRGERARKRRNRIRIGAAALIATLIGGAALGWWGGLSTASRLNSAEVLNLTRDAVDICEHAHMEATTRDPSGGQRVAVAFECVDVLNEGIEDLPSNMRLPERVKNSFETNLAIIRASKEKYSLTADQLAVLERAERIATRFGEP